jgi:hemoglobin
MLSIRSRYIVSVTFASGTKVWTHALARSIVGGEATVTLLEKYGRYKVTVVVQEFYGDLLHDPELAPYFAHVSIPGLVEHQAIFLSTVMGGPDSYTPNDIMQAHSPLGIGPKDFERMIDHLEARLTGNGFHREDVAEIIATYQEYQDAVVDVSA